MVPVRLLPLLLLSSCAFDPPLPESPTFDKDIILLVQQRCSSCHNSTSVVPNWLNYDVIANPENQKKIITRILKKRDMPPGGLPEREIRIFQRWILQGAVR